MLHRTIERPRPNRRPPPATRSAAIRPRSIASKPTGQCRIATETQTVYGDHAVYDVDRDLLVVTGKNLKLVTPRDTLTARDSLEWYDDKQLAVARGDALAIREGKTHARRRADRRGGQAAQRGVAYQPRRRARPRARLVARSDRARR